MKCEVDQPLSCFVKGKKEHTWNSKYDESNRFKARKKGRNK